MLNHVGKLILFFVFSLVLHSGGLLIQPPAASIDSQDTVVGVALLSKSGDDFLPSSRDAEELMSSEDPAPEERKTAVQNDAIVSAPDLQRTSEFHETPVLKKQMEQEQSVFKSKIEVDSLPETSEETFEKGSSGPLKEKVVADNADRESGTSGQISSIGETKKDRPDSDRAMRDSGITENTGGANTAAPEQMEHPSETAPASGDAYLSTNPGRGGDREAASMADPGDKQEKIQRSALPLYDENPRPEYPKVARLRGWEGTVRLEVLVLKDGRVGHVDLVDSSGHSILDRTARKTVHRWKFKPALSMGIAVDSKVQVPISFRLN